MKLAKIFVNSLRLINLAAETEERRIPVGGQAVIEGVLMKGPEHWGLAVREPEGKIWFKSWLSSKWLEKPVWKLPIIRGCATMVDMMRVGMNALSISAEVSLGEEDTFSPWELAGSILFALLFVVGLFIALPMFLSEFVSAHCGLSAVWKNCIEGIVRAFVFIGYVAVISLWKDMRRVFEYHGAEHKTINAYEHYAELTPENVAKYSRIHRRCGTSFLLIVVFVSIIVFSFIRVDTAMARVLSRVVLLPLVIGISYEFIRAAAKSDGWGKTCIAPALTLQYVTTRVPSEDQLEVAIAALDLALHPEKDNSAEWENKKKLNAENSGTNKEKTDEMQV